MKQYNNISYVVNGYFNGEHIMTKIEYKSGKTIIYKHNSDMKKCHSDIVNAFLTNGAHTVMNATDEITLHYYEL